jgi:hypothetical protein
MAWLYKLFAYLDFDLIPSSSAAPKPNQQPNYTNASDDDSDSDDAPKKVRNFGGFHYMDDM